MWVDATASHLVKSIDYAGSADSRKYIQVGADELLHIGRYQKANRDEAKNLVPVVRFAYAIQSFTIWLTMTSLFYGHSKAFKTGTYC
jgi:hypothetical protein